MKGLEWASNGVRYRHSCGMFTDRTLDPLQGHAIKFGSVGDQESG